jgi:imidazolonepropionase
MEESNTYLLGPISQLLPMNELPLRGAIPDEKLNVIHNAGFVVQNGLIAEIGDYSTLISKYSHLKKVVFDRDVVVLPGFVDCHTHLCWDGSRARDFSMRNAGYPYLEIAESGGGIWDTVIKTRQASDEALVKNIVQRSSQAASWGVTTIEVKSGYGLSVDQEIRLLRLINKAGQESKLDVIPTCLAAHTVPKEYAGNAVKYLDDIAEQVLPVIRSERLSTRVDIFVERSAFDTQQAWDFLIKAKSMGFDILIHADQFSTGGSMLGARLGAVSVDHLEASTDAEISIVAISDCVAVALPGASLGLGEPFTPVRKILDSGGIVAIASDWNPGSAPMGDLLIQASILATKQKLTTAEVLSGLTFRATKALKLSDRGDLSQGKLADFQCYNTRDYREILYQQGLLKPSEVWKKGVRIYEK